MLYFLPIIYNDFLLKNLWWIVAICVIAILLILLLVERCRSNKKKKEEISEETTSLYLEALGGKENIIDKALEGSRIVLHLVDYKAVNRDKLREAGVTGFIQMSDRLTLVIKSDAMEVYKKIFPSE